MIHYCLRCGKRTNHFSDLCLEHWRKWFSDHRSFYRECTDKYCVECGKPIIENKKRKRCPSCLPGREAFYEEYRKRMKDLSVLFECSCNVSRKINHHPDYSKPTEVYRLCNKCHAIEHRRLRIIRIAIILFYFAVRMTASKNRTA